MSEVRVRFAPSPTGPLHIGGVRTALYNYLFALKNRGTFILRIEDTDQVRYVPGAEKYIIESLKWCGLIPHEGPGFGGDYGPYRQSERKDIYRAYAEQLVHAGHAYYAFDSAEELDALRKEDPNFKYGVYTRSKLKNSLALSSEETMQYLNRGENVVIRLRIPENEQIDFVDEIRGHVSFDSNELDDKVILKGDGMPTYHLANIVDDHLMKISHVIRGEEWLSSTAHHVLMYRFFGWTAPVFAHLPLILKPTGQGKLSKRDGAQFGFPVFPLNWNDANPAQTFPGFREEGYLPEALLNFLAFLGWNPGTEQEIFSVKELAEVFTLDKIVKSGARFDIEKALWFNQHYLIHTDDYVLAALLRPLLREAGTLYNDAYLAEVCNMMKERVHRINEIPQKAAFFFHPVFQYDDQTLLKKYKPVLRDHFLQIAERILQSDAADAASCEKAVKDYITEQSLKMGDILPVLRIAVSGTMQGPDLFRTIALLGKDETHIRIQNALEHFDRLFA
ncbi:MAG: glutamate--tRNA ligase [Saprospiraceae bacterium]|nr:glutamate--tRNA ligase [Saprospiraceae bacterium]